MWEDMDSSRRTSIDGSSRWRVTLAALAIAVFACALPQLHPLTTEEVGDGLASPLEKCVITDLNNSPPHDVDFTYEPSDPDNGLTVFLNASAVDDDGDTLSYSWDFGDGGSASGSNVSHQFMTVGDNNVTLSVDDGVAGPDPRPVSISKAITVTGNSPPTVKFWNSGAYYRILPRVGSLFETNFTEIDVRDVVRLTWIWDDGTIEVRNMASTGGMVSVPIYHSFNEQGYYNVIVWADDLTALPGHNVSDYVYVIAFGYNWPPSISSFFVDNSHPSTGEPVTFGANVTDSDHDICHLTFDFGDGASAHFDQPWNAKTCYVTHTYDSPGVFQAFLYVIDYHLPGSGRASPSATDGYPGERAGPVNITVSRAVFNLSLMEGWNLVSVPLVNCSYNASDLGLDVGDLIVGFNVSRHAYGVAYIVGLSPPCNDFAIAESTGYWIYSNSAKVIQLQGSYASITQVREIPDKGWAIVGFNTRSLTWHASNVPSMFTDGNVSVVAHLLPSGSYESYIAGLPATDFLLAPGVGYWCYFTSGGSLTYLP
jgi:hypothetical protein